MRIWRLAILAVAGAEAAELLPTRTRARRALSTSFEVVTTTSTGVSTSTSPITSWTDLVILSGKDPGANQAVLTGRLPDSLYERNLTGSSPSYLPDSGVRRIPTKPPSANLQSRQLDSFYARLKPACEKPELASFACSLIPDGFVAINVSLAFAPFTTTFSVTVPHTLTLDDLLPGQARNAALKDTLANAVPTLPTPTATDSTNAAAASNDGVKTVYSTELIGNGLGIKSTAQVALPAPVWRLLLLGAFVWF
jgi:hypothetical protein